jgi:membrane fusion protein, multidrug efflux system
LKAAIVSDRSNIHPPISSAGATASVEPTATPVRRRRLGWWLVLGLLLIVALVSWRVHQRRHEQAAIAQQAQDDAQPVEVAIATNADLHIVLNSIGTVTPLATVTVRSQVNGQLQTVGFVEGQIVHKGDLLAQIDPRPYQAQLKQAEGQLARDVALLNQAKTDLARYQTLLGQDSIARQQAEDQEFLVRQYQASIVTDQGQIDMQKLNLTYCRITSPVDGRVGLRQLDPGNYVQTSDTGGIVVITQLQPISVIFALPEDDLPEVLERFHGGANLSVALYDRANNTELSTGAVSTIDNQIDTTTGTWKLRALFTNADEMLFPSQFVNARLIVESLHDVLTVPRAAVQTGAPGTYVYLLKPDHTVTVKPIKTGPVDGDHVQILSGLAVGDNVVVSGVDRLREGSRVALEVKRSGPAV